MSELTKDMKKYVSTKNANKPYTPEQLYQMAKI